jgi:hypothetical protein
LQAQTHGGMTTEDGKTTFACQQQSPPLDALWILDTSQVAERKADPKPIVRARIDTGDNQWCQNALRVTYRGHPFLIQFGERSGAPDCGRVADNWATFGYPRFYDLADDRAPRLVATAMLASALPQNCGTVKGEGALNGLGYSVHQCSVDRLYDPTILACSWFFSGMRVLDIRDPHHPVELAYYNPGVGTVVGTAPRPIIRSDRHEIWFGNDTGGFYAVRFENNVWPFAGSARCPEFDDYYFAQYNPGSSCPTANTNGIGKPAPGLTWGAKLTRVSVGRVRPGGRSRVRFTLSAMSELTLEVRRGGRRVTKRVIDVGAGRGSVLLPALTRGRYTITVKPAGGRTTRLGLTVR